MWKTWQGTQLALRPVQMRSQASAGTASKLAMPVWPRPQLQPLLQLSSLGTSRSKCQGKVPVQAAQESSAKGIPAQSHDSSKKQVLLGLRVQPAL